VASPAAGNRGYDGQHRTAWQQCQGARGLRAARPQASLRAGRRCWADNATAERREAASRLRGRVHASQAWRRALLRDTYKAVTSSGAPPIPSGSAATKVKRKEEEPGRN